LPSSDELGGLVNLKGVVAFRTRHTNTSRAKARILSGVIRRD
jgi:hypothetical protein